MTVLDPKDAMVAPPKRRFWGWPAWWLAVLGALVLLILEHGIIAAAPALAWPFIGLYILVVLVALAALVAGLRRTQSRIRATTWGALGSVVQFVLLVSIAMVLGVRNHALRAAWHEQGNVSFRELACKGYERGAPARVAAAHWENDVLVIKAPVCVNCSLHVDTVAAKVDGDALSVTITPEKATGLVAACDCERSLDIRIKSLPRRDYALRGIEAVHGCI